MENVDILTMNGKLNTNVDIQAIIDVVSSEYIQSCEIKKRVFVCDEPMKNRLFDFTNLLQLITKIKYPTNTKLLLILVPNIYEFDKSRLLDVKMFEKLKNIVLSESEENKRKMFTYL